jgi:hypothetical protein
MKKNKFNNVITKFKNKFSNIFTQKKSKNISVKRKNSIDSKENKFLSKQSTEKKLFADENLSMSSTLLNKQSKNNENIYLLNIELKSEKILVKHYKLLNKYEPNTNIKEISKHEKNVVLLESKLNLLEEENKMIETKLKQFK